MIWPALFPLCSWRIKSLRIAAVRVHCYGSVRNKNNDALSIKLEDGKRAEKRNPELIWNRFLIVIAERGSSFLRCHAGIGAGSSRLTSKCP